MKSQEGRRKVKKKARRQICLVALLITAWVVGIEFFAHGIWQQVFFLIKSNPLYFLGLMVIPLVAIFSVSMIWRQILIALYGHKINPTVLAKYVLGDLGVSFFMTSFGGAGRLTRAGLLSSRGVKPSEALASTIIDGIIFTLQSTTVVFCWIVFSYFGLTTFGKQLIWILGIWLVISLGGLSAVLLIVKLRLVNHFLKNLQDLPKFRRLLSFSKDLEEALTKIFDLSRKNSFIILGWLLLANFGDIAELWFLTRLVGAQLDFPSLFLLKFLMTIVFVLGPTPLGLGTMDLSLVGVFTAFGYSLNTALYFIMLWRLKNTIYAAAGITIIGSVAWKKVENHTVNNSKER